MPYQILYEGGQDGFDEERHMIEMSSILQKFSRYGPLRWGEVAQAAKEVVSQLESLDEELYNHLVKVLDEGIHATSMMHNVVPEILVSNPDKSKKIWNDLKKKKKRDWKPKDHEYFGKLDLWIRKWISEAFVGIISHEELLYIYDILFMHHWKPDIFVTLSLMFLGMLKPWLMRTTTNKEAVTVLLEEADKLYVNDIRKCLVLFSANRKDFYRLAEGNTNYIITEKEPPKEEKKPAEEEANTEAETNDDDKKEDNADAEVEENQDGQNSSDDAENKNEGEDEKKPEEETLMDKVEDAIDAVGL